jgi:1-acyl-sn-glycerol-3-phosphate acyltransferase
MPMLLLPRYWMFGALHFWSVSVRGMLRVICGIELRVTGWEHMPPSGPCLVAAKHQSAFDTIVWLSLLPDVAYVLKRELIRIPLYGALARKSGMIAVDRSAGATAMRGLIREGRAAAEAGRQILIFPEGTRVAPGQRVTYHPGVAALASATGLPVIPAATDSGLRWGRRAFRKAPGAITLSILPPLPTGLRKDELMARLETAIEDETARLLARAGHGGAVDKPGD